MSSVSSRAACRPDPEQLGTTLDGGAFFAFLALAAVGLDAAYPQLDLDSYL